MHRFLVPPLLAAFACVSEPPDPLPDGRPFTVVSYNVMCNFCVLDEFDRWSARVPFHHEILDEHAPDLIGMQELFLFDDIALYLDAHPEYDALFYIDDGDGLFEVYADSTIFYRRDRFRPIENGFFWLSDTPDVPFSKGFAEGAQLPRLVAWARMEQITDGRTFLFATSHVDNNSPSQELSMPLFLNRLPELADGDPILVVGDFNSRPASVAYGLLTDGGEFVDSFDLVEFEVLTNEEPPHEYAVDERIDHVFFTPGDFEVDRWAVDTRVFGPNARPPSDHFPIVTELRF